MIDPNFPAPFLRALTNDSYDNGGSDFSVTGLLQPPQITFLAANHEPKETSVYASYAALMGTTIHTLLESHADPEQGEVPERRFFVEMEGLKISGCVDLYEENKKKIADWKFVGGHMEEIKEPYRLQLHMNGYLAEENGVEVEEVELVVIQRDWSYMRSQFSADYPKSPYKRFNYKYDRDLAIYTFGSRLAEHIDAKQGNPRPCTPAEQWRDPTRYAVKKPANKRARKLFDTREEATMDKKTGEIIEVREGEATFCQSFCKYSHVCPQYLKESEGN
tara:strand:- start:6253 stop:7080 length:828 start_codon:yes stop_codon:yes gene_type:complete